MPVKYGFFEQLKDFLRQGPKAYLASIVVAIVMVFFLIAVLAVPEFGVAMLFLGLVIAAVLSILYIMDNW